MTAEPGRPSSRADARRVLERLSGRVPVESVARIERFVAAQACAAPPQQAATVVLLRDGPDGLEVYLQHRHGRMPFAPGHVVFPGGRAEPGEGPVECAVREALEETSVRLDPTDLLPWAHWTTPEFEPRRYDTRFFVARLPDGAACRDVSGETDSARWSPPADALADLAAGRVRMLPPTQSILVELTELPDWAAVVEAARDRMISEVLPRVVHRDGTWWFDYGLGGES